MKTGVLATIGSIFLAIAASACCWLPMLLLATGVSAAGAGSFLGPLRPFLLGFAVVLLGIGLYVTYRPRRVECGPDGSCSAPRQPWLQRIGRYGLWFSLLLVAASALMPRYAGGFRHASTNSLQSSIATDTLVLGVAGMSCAGCEPAIEEALSRVPGVVAAKVSYDTKHATVTVARAKSPSRLALVTAVHAAGYEITPASETLEPPSLAGHWTGDVHLDSTQTPEMILDIDRLGSRWVGEFDVAEFGVENYPVRIEFVNGRVTLRFSAAEADFEGALSAEPLDGRLLLSGSEVRCGVREIGQTRVLRLGSRIRRRSG